MKTILKQFLDEPLFDACAAMLSHLQIKFNEVTRTPVPFEGLYPAALTKALQELMAKVEYTYFIGTVDEASLSGHASVRSDLLDVRSDAVRTDLQSGLTGYEHLQCDNNAEGRYAGMMIFAVNIVNGQTLTRTEMATLTRGFNRIAAAQPVVLFIRQTDRLALATCERSEYTQQWRDGEKLGKVSLLRDIDCRQPHRGHIDILESIGDKAYPNFEELYKHWMQVFSSELLTKKFYGELSDWYAWAVQVARFPNDLTTNEDDEKFNHESCIRLITRLIFVWFLRQKRLVPEEFFDERYIREHFIEEFNPHDRQNLLYNPEKSRYYRLILQNLFFAMLNRPIVPEGKDTPNNRKFRGDGQLGYKRDGYNVNNLMRYKSDFKAGGADEFLKMANSHVPFLNGGLFDCLDDKPQNLYYDGFSERKESLEQLYLPDWLFFGDEVGRSIDLSQWYGDTKKKSVSARGIIDILKRYNFTIEENTPLDQEVSLDPELLGKAFENLLASYNPETKTSARKQTGSFYTPREIVQYMVDESLVAHLKRICGDELEPQYRSLLNYATEETSLTEEQRRNMMQAIYNCRVLDPACGSGAFPMGVLQQMVHILRQLDPTNEMWKDFMIDLAIEQSRKAFSEEQDEERKVRLADIEEAFDRNINDPDYARKLYLIEHCIFGVDIQPIAVQISKLRFFISLVVDQKPTDDATHNFGIRPLPNLESKFVAANTLIPVKYDGTLVESAPEVRKNKDKLKELNHKIFLAKRNVDKQRLKNEIKETRKALAEAIENTGFVGHSEAELLAGWDMFEQNASSSYFDAEWMFGVKGGFDIVIANPPYVVVPKNNIYANYFQTKDCLEMYAYFYEKAIKLLSSEGVLSFITASLFIKGIKFETLRSFLERNSRIISLNVVGDDVFENVQMPTAILVTIKDYGKWSFESMIPGGQILSKMEKSGLTLNSISNIQRGFEIGRNLVSCYGEYPFITGSNVTRYVHTTLSYISRETYLSFAKEDYYYTGERLLIRETGSSLTVVYEDEKIYCNRSLYSIKIKDSNYFVKYVLACLNTKACQYYYSSKFKSDTDLFPKIRIKQARLLPIPFATNKQQLSIIDLVDGVLYAKRNNPNADTSSLEQQIDFLVYHLYGLTYDEVLIVDPETPITREEYEQTS